MRFGAGACKHMHAVMLEQNASTVARVRTAQGEVGYKTQDGERGILLSRDPDRPTTVARGCRSHQEGAVPLGRSLPPGMRPPLRRRGSLLSHRRPMLVGACVQGVSGEGSYDLVAGYRSSTQARRSFRPCLRGNATSSRRKRVCFSSPVFASRSQTDRHSKASKTLRRSAVNHRGGPLLPPGVTATQTLD